MYMIQLCEDYEYELYEKIIQYYTCAAWGT